MDVTRYIALEADIPAQITGRERDEFLDWSPDDFLMIQSSFSVTSELEALHAVAEARRTEIQMIHASTSWKITAPLRLTAQVLRGRKSTATESQD